MTAILVLASILLPLTMFYLRKKWAMLHAVFNVIALVSMLVFGNIAAVAVYQIIRDNTVFMTNIHAIFLNPFFLMTSSYFGIYIIYQLLNATLKS